MRYGIVAANLGEYADPRVAVRLAQAAEAAGWEAFFVWDHLGFVRGLASGDPWVILSAVAASTTRLKLGIAVTPLARRRPQVVANALASMDLLSGGRVIFGAGLGGVPEEFSAFGEMVAEIRRHRTTDAPFEVAVDGYSEPGDPALPRAYGAAGATWWLESIHDMRDPLSEAIARVKAGPGDAMRSSDAAQEYSDAAPAHSRKSSEPRAADPSNSGMIRAATEIRCPSGTGRRTRCAR
jgi:Luciferase-like monooxygenase